MHDWLVQCESCWTQWDLGRNETMGRGIWGLRAECGPWASLFSPQDFFQATSTRHTLTAPDSSIVHIACSCSVKCIQIPEVAICTCPFSRVSLFQDWEFHHAFEILKSRNFGGNNFHFTPSHIFIECFIRAKILIPRTKAATQKILARVYSLLNSTELPT